MRPHRAAPTGKPATTGNPVLIAHCRELLRLAEAGEIVNLLATARYADRAVWKVAAAGSFDPAIGGQIAARFQAIVAAFDAPITADTEAAAGTRLNIAVALPEART